MTTFIKCELCDAEIPEDGCVFATHKKVIDGKEYKFCCSVVLRKFMFDRTAIDPEDDQEK